MLIDFTYDAMVALWFACELYTDKQTNEEKDGKVFVIKDDNELREWTDEKKTDIFEFLKEQEQSKNAKNSSRMDIDSSSTIGKWNHP